MKRSLRLLGRKWKWEGQGAKIIKVQEDSRGEGAMKSNHSHVELLKEWNIHLQKEETQMDPRADLQLQEVHHMDQKMSPFCSPRMSEPVPMGEAIGKLSVVTKDEATSQWRYAAPIREAQQRSVLRAEVE